MNIFQLSFFLLLFHSLSQAQQLHNELYYTNCSVTNYTANTTFETNLNSLFPILISNARFVTFFYTEKGKNPDTAYGLFHCRADVTFNTCSACVDQATQDAKQWCPNRRRAVLWYDYCMMRYSDRNFQSMYDSSFNTIVLSRSPRNTSDPRPFNQTLNGLLQNLTSEALTTLDLSVRNMAMGEANFIASRKIYAIVQCTPDLSRNDCNTCLQTTISEIQVCCDGRDGALISEASCAMRYEVFPFYAGAASVPPPPRPPPPSVTDSSSGKHGFADVGTLSDFLEFDCYTLVLCNLLVAVVSMTEL